MQTEIQFRSLIESELTKKFPHREPEKLYEPIRYMISLGGKRLRPAILLMCHELFNGNPENVIEPALGIEVFHNFTLLHDDIMDKAPLRRSRETVHTKWSPDVAILSGDAMFVIACQLMMNVKNNYVRDVMEVFLKTAIEVCEGQQIDMDYEKVNEVSIQEYIRMISLKTASLIGCSAYIGAITAGANISEANHLYEFGRSLGIAFQLNDDILDTYGDPEKFGKQIGGDILANKKTILLLTAIQKAQGNIKTELTQWLSGKDIDNNKIAAVTAIYEKLDVKRHATEKMDFYFRKAMEELEAVAIPVERKTVLSELAERLMVREQ